MAATLSKVDASEYLVNGDPLAVTDLGLTVTTTELNLLTGLTSTGAEINTAVTDSAFATTAVLVIGSIDLNNSFEDYYGAVPFDCTATAFYIAETTGTGSAALTIKNDAGSTMGSVSCGTSGGSVESDTTLSSTSLTTGDTWRVTVGSQTGTADYAGTGLLLVTLV